MASARPPWACPWPGLHGACAAERWGMARKMHSWSHFNSNQAAPDIPEMVLQILRKRMMVSEAAFTSITLESDREHGTQHFLALLCLAFIEIPSTGLQPASGCIAGRAEGPCASPRRWRAVNIARRAAGWQRPG